MMTTKEEDNTKRIDHNRGVVLIAVLVGVLANQAVSTTDRLDVTIAYLFLTALGIGLCLLWVD